MNEGGMTYSVCVSNCNKTRQDKCSGCSLTGPAVLNPGQDGTWTDGKTNSGEWQKGKVTLKSRTFEGGYVATMPTGGAGPFTVQVCYGEDARTCCEAEVDFPPCSLTGPSKLATGEEGEYVPSLGMAGATAVVSDMTYRKTETAFIAKLNSGACSGTITVSYGGRLCGAIPVANTMADVVGVVIGPSAMDKGETAYFAHNLTAATYVGTLEVVSQTGNSAILKMPDDAEGERVAEWVGMCGVVASMSVSTEEDCTLGPDIGLCHNGTLSPGDIVHHEGVCYSVGSQCATVDSCGNPHDPCTDSPPYYHLFRCGVVVCPGMYVPAPIYSLIPL